MRFIRACSQQAAGHRWDFAHESEAGSSGAGIGGLGAGAGAHTPFGTSPAGPLEMPLPEHGRAITGIDVSVVQRC